MDRLGLKIVFAGLVACALSTDVRAETRIGAESRIALDPSWLNPRYISFRPQDGKVVRVNPPRFSWPYLRGVRFGLRPILEVVRAAGEHEVWSLVARRGALKSAADLIDWQTRNQDDKPWVWL